MCGECDEDRENIEGSAQEEAERHVRALLRYIGEDPNRPGLAETPRRFLKAWRESWGVGYAPATANMMKLFPHEGSSYNQMVFVGSISFFSHCEHHLAPFYGVAHVAYIADKNGPGLIGLSKLARLVEHKARRLQVQERLTQQIADELHLGMQGASVAVQLRAVHMCMMSRGVQQPTSQTITSALYGDFLNDPKTHHEFLRQCDASSAR